MRYQLFNLYCDQHQLQPFGYHEISINHEHSDAWCERGINGLFSGFLNAFAKPIKSSFYVPRLCRLFLMRGGTVLT